MSNVVRDSLFRVIKVIDGDTFWVEGRGRRFKVRFIGVDAPEIRNSQYKKKGYFASEAREFVRRLCEGKFVRLEYDVQSTDRYQRDLAYVYLEDGLFLNAALLQGGYAVVATFPPNVRYVDYFLELQRKARRKRNGLWAQ
ncbi:Staphylococcus nuclease (SNase) domain [Sphingobacterium sp. JB170]|nr:Staphylococcus nuclease (SNase) domain [Sphingobacterium sp. JB170]